MPSLLPFPRDARNGFTLVEGLVVAAILAILAAVAIPTYSGYVQSQRRQVALGLAQTGAVSANVFRRRTGASPTLVSQLNLFYDPARYLIWIQGNYVHVRDITRPAPDTVEANALF